MEVLGLRSASLEAKETKDEGRSLRLDEGRRAKPMDEGRSLRLDEGRRTMEAANGYEPFGWRFEERFV